MFSVYGMLVCIMTTKINVKGNCSCSFRWTFASASPVNSYSPSWFLHDICESRYFCWHALKAYFMVFITIVIPFCVGCFFFMVLIGGCFGVCVYVFSLCTYCDVHAQDCRCSGTSVEKNINTSLLPHRHKVPPPTPHHILPSIHKFPNPPPHTSPPPTPPSIQT